MTPRLSVIVPARNEARVLPLLLGDLGRQRGIALETLVADGGSTDGTADAARGRGARVVAAPRGRGVQMNRAAARARGDWLLFLHADTRIREPGLLARAVDRIAAEQARTPDRVTAGHFGLVFGRTSPRHASAYAFLEAKSRLNRPYTTNGDQGLLLARRGFEELGGFDTTFPVFEDQEMAERIRRRGRLVTLPGVIETSARRFETEGFWPRYLLMAVITACYWSGVHGFLAEAPRLYPDQDRAGPLRLGPFLGLLRRTLRRMDRAERRRAWRRAGRFLCRNAWQPFLFLDLLGRPLWGSRRPALGSYDRLLAPVLEGGWLDLPAAVLARVVFLGLLPPLLGLVEGRGAAGPGQGMASGRAAP